MKQLTVTVTADTTTAMADQLTRLADELSADATSGHRTTSVGSVTYTTTDLDQPLDELAAATAATIAAEEHEVRVALLGMCRKIREQFPTAARIVLEDSDQGPWAVVAAIEDGTGAVVEEAEDWCDNDGYHYAGHLYDSRTDVWTPYLVDGSSVDRRNPCRGTLVIDKVLAALG